MAPRLLVMASPGKTMSTPPSPCSTAIAILPSMRQRRTSTRQTETPPLLIIQLSKRAIIIPSESGLPCGQQYNLGVSKLATPLNHLLTDCKKPRRCSISICWKTYHRITAAAPTYQALLLNIPKILGSFFKCFRTHTLVTLSAGRHITTSLHTFLDALASLRPILFRQCFFLNCR